jgi:hypothetical protein
MSMLHAVAGLMPKTPPLPSYAFQATTFDGTAQTVYTFAGQNIGAASTTRYVVAAVALISSAVRTVSSVTIGGVTATVVPNGQTETLSFRYHIAFYIAAVPTGTTASVVVTASGACDAAALSGVWALYDLSSATPVDSDGDPTGASPFSVPSVNTSADGILLAAGMYLRNSGTAAFGWTNATERSDLSSSFSGATVGNSAADAATNGAGVVVSATIAGTVDAGVMVVASFR